MKEKADDKIVRQYLLNTKSAHIDCTTFPSSGTDWYKRLEVIKEKIIKTTEPRPTKWKVWENHYTIKDSNN
jgi:hypothetical protein